MTEDNFVLLCDMNNIAVEHLVSGHFEGARVAFANASRAAKALLEDNADTYKISTGKRSSPGTETPSPDLLFQTSTMYTHCTRDSSAGLDTPTSVADFASSEDGAFVYHRAFKLRYDHAIPPLEIICSTILYNMVSTMIHQDNWSPCSVPIS